MRDNRELEIYACIDGYPNYLVTSHGRILSLKGKKIKELKSAKNKEGYLFVCLCKNNKKINKTVHRLVAQTFISNPNNKSSVNHIDEDKTNNHVSNLEWVTQKENINHGSHNQRSSKTRSKKVMAKSLSQTKVLVFKSTSNAIKFGFHCGAISECCHGKKKTYKGYQWSYLEEYKKEEEK